MPIKITGAREHNLQGIDVEIQGGLTVVTGISGSGKTSLVFDTLYHEARRRFLDIFGFAPLGSRLAPARVQSIHGLGPAIAVGQNLLNRNPNSTLASASGLNPFLRLLYARFGLRYCTKCGTEVSQLSEEEVIEALLVSADKGEISVFAPLVQAGLGGHRTLLELLEEQFGRQSIYVDGEPWASIGLNPDIPHKIEIRLGQLSAGSSPSQARAYIKESQALGCSGVKIQTGGGWFTYSTTTVCVNCGTWLGELEAAHFNMSCPNCGKLGCERCSGSGLHPIAAGVRWLDLRFDELINRSAAEVKKLFDEAQLPNSALRLKQEIVRRLAALNEVSLGYISLDRPSPSLSRGESQRVRLAVALTSRLEDMLYVFDEPTIGQHPVDTALLMSAFRQLSGSVVFVEHDRIAAATADQALDLGPGAGESGGKVVYEGVLPGLWKAETQTGRFFSLRERVHTPPVRGIAKEYLVVRGASLHNLKNIDVPFPIGRLTVVTGVSGSGKSTLVEDVLVASLKSGTPVGCERLEGQLLKAVIVDQSPIGRNPRSNPATYTRLSDIIRDLYASSSCLSALHFSFNRESGACPQCKGMGAVEIKMRYLPSTWIVCAQCEGSRFSEKVLEQKVPFGEEELSIADFYRLSISRAAALFDHEDRIPKTKIKTACRMLQALQDVGLGYLTLGQPSPTLSGGEAQRVKLAKHLGRRKLAASLIVLDEPSTGLHPHDLAGLLFVLDRLVREGATALVVEHNTDVIRSADWVIDLGPGAGLKGGKLLYAGPVGGLAQIGESSTGRALSDERNITPGRESFHPRRTRREMITIQGARVNNLKNISLEIPKGKLVVVTGVSGSGKSSLVSDTLEVESRRRFLETLSLYERQGTREGPQAQVDQVSGLGVAVSISDERQAYSRRSTVGTQTEISHHLAVLLSFFGERECPQCSTALLRDGAWRCKKCGFSADLPHARHFSPGDYVGACTTCHGVGSLQVPNPDKLILNPELPLCNGAMYSPGFFPKGYLCQPYNVGYYLVQALSQRYGFDPEVTPWKEMSESAQQAFLYGIDQPLVVHVTNRKGKTYVRELPFPGFYGWVGEWDVGGTYTDTRVCQDCGGARLRPEFDSVTLCGYSLHQLSSMPMVRLYKVMNELDLGITSEHPANPSLKKIQHRLEFLIQVGLGYIHLERISATLSAGEAQRIKLAAVLGAGLTSLTILLDEPTRGLHPSEVDALLQAMISLRDGGCSVIVVEHDPAFLRAAEHIIDMGPGAGSTGGMVVAQGSPHQVAAMDTVTGKWLRDRGASIHQKAERQPAEWMVIRGARANNLQGEVIHIPLGMLVGVCGVSGSGKSSLLVDTLGRALSPKKITTSVAYEPLEPGEFEAIQHAPERTLVVDQVKAGIRSPGDYLGVIKSLTQLYAGSEGAAALGLDPGAFKRGCSACKGRGYARIDMGFLPGVRETCETCRGTGHLAEVWDVKLDGAALPELYTYTLTQVMDLFGDIQAVGRPLKAAQEVGLGYLALRQPRYSLSGGEAQRLRIAAELCRKSKDGTLYILDEPTVGQHMQDVLRLVGVLLRLVEDGHSVLVIEHHPHLLAACDWLIELGPGGGPEGGKVIAQGLPREMASGSTPIAMYLREVLGA